MARKAGCFTAICRRGGRRGHRRKKRGPAPVTARAGERGCGRGRLGGGRERSSSGGREQRSSGRARTIRGGRSRRHNPVYGMLGVLTRWHRPLGKEPPPSRYRLSPPWPSGWPDGWPGCGGLALLVKHKVPFNYVCRLRRLLPLRDAGKFKLGFAGSHVTCENLRVEVHKMTPTLLQSVGVVADRRPSLF